MTLKNIKNKLNFAERGTCSELREILLERGDLTGKQGLLDKSEDEDEVRGEHVKLVPGRRKNETLL